VPGGDPQQQRHGERHARGRQGAHRELPQREPPERRPRPPQRGRDQREQRSAPLGALERVGRVHAAEREQVDADRRRDDVEHELRPRQLPDDERGGGDRPQRLRLLKQQHDGRVAVRERGGEGERRDRRPAPRDHEQRRPPARVEPAQLRDAHGEEGRHHRRQHEVLVEHDRPRRPAAVDERLSDERVEAPQRGAERDEHHAVLGRADERQAARGAHRQP
jgi:hypothetical protein